MYKFFNIAIIVFCIIGYMNVLSGQSYYTLESAVSDAVKNTPAFISYDIIKKENELKVNNLSSKYLPQFSIQGQATYQSETTGLDINFPGFSIPRLSQDQYKIQLDVNQFIYDGGATAIQKSLADVGADLENAQIDVDIEQLKEQIIHIYFGLLDIGARLEMIAFKKQDMEAVIKRVRTATENGVILPAELKNLQAEMLVIDQSEAELLALKQGQIKILNILTGNNLDNAVALTMPSDIMSTELNFLSRPMFRLLSLKKSLLDQSKKLEFSLSKPRLMFFAQAGYGKPGLNFLKNEFTPYYIGGIRLQWNLNDLYTKSKSNQITTLQMQKTDAKSALYAQQVEVRLATLESEIIRSSAQMKADDQIISLRQEIKRAVAVKLEQGTATSSEYLLILNDENEAHINKKIHQLQFTKAGYLYNHHAGRGL